MTWPMPRQCIIELDTRCNLACQTCNIWRRHFKGPSKVRLPIPLEKAKNIFHKLSQAGILQVTVIGGEPLLYPFLFPLIRYGHSLGLAMAIVTNGTLFNDEAINQAMDANLDTVIFSIDGPAPVHDLIRGQPGTFASVYRNIKKLGQRKKAGHLKKPRICIYTTVSKLNYALLQEMLEVAQTLDANAIRFQLVSAVSPYLILATNQIFGREVVGWHSYAVPSELSLSSEQRSGLKSWLRQSARPWSEKTGIGLMVESVINGGNPPLCPFIHRSFAINQEGKIIPCPMMPELTIGQIEDTDLGKTWVGEKNRQFLKMIKNHFPLPVCRQCCVEKTI